MLLLYHAYVYLEFLILACTIYILAPQQVDTEVEVHTQFITSSIGDREKGAPKHSLSTKRLFVNEHDEGKVDLACISLMGVADIAAITKA